MKITRLVGVGGATLLATVLLPACGSSDSNDSSSSTAASVNKATGSPVKVMMILDESDAANVHLDEARAGAAARVKRINESGGLGGSGHPVDVTYCQTKLDPNTANDCARQAAKDPGIVATVGSVVSEDVGGILKSAGLANVMGQPFTAGDFSLPNSFPTNGGAIAGGGIATIAAKDLGAKKVNCGVVQLPGAQQAVQLQNAALASNGAKPLAKVVQIPVTASDVSSQVSAMADGADAVTTIVSPAQSQQLLLARQQLGIKVPFIGASAAFPSASLKALGPAADDLLLQAFYPTDDVDLPGNTAFKADMKAAGSQDKAGDLAKEDWVSFDLFNYAMKGAKTFTRASVMTALNGVTDYDAGGLTPVLNFSKPGPDPKFPRIHNLSYFFAKIDNGKAVSAGTGKLEPIYGEAH